MIIYVFALHFLAGESEEERRNDCKEENEETAKGECICFIYIIQYDAKEDLIEIVRMFHNRQTRYIVCAYVQCTPMNGLAKNE